MRYHGDALRMARFDLVGIRFLLGTHAGFFARRVLGAKRDIRI